MSKNLAGKDAFHGSDACRGRGLAVWDGGSSAWSLTFTPTYQEGIFFVREEVSLVQASSITPGLAFGRSGGSHSQARVMLETGIVF